MKKVSTLSLFVIFTSAPNAFAHSLALNCIVLRECTTVAKCETTRKSMTIQFEQSDRYVKLEFPANDKVFYLTNQTRLRDNHHLQAARSSASEAEGKSSLTVFHSGAFIYTTHLAAAQSQAEDSLGANLRLKSGYCQGETS